MKTVLRILLLGIAIGAFIATRRAQAERQRLLAALAAAEKTASERAILPPDLDARLEEGARITQQINWERQALGLPPYKLDDFEEGEDE